MTHEKWDAPSHHKEEKGLMDKKVTFQFSVGAFLKIIFVLALLIGVFMLGRWSVGPVSTTDGAVHAVPIETKSEPGFFSRIFGGSSEANEPQVTASVVSVDSNSSSNSSNSTVSAVVVPAPTSVVDVPVVVAPVVANATVPVVAGEETVLTAYPAGTLAFSVVNVQKEWYDTWGKVTRLEVTFKNNAEGTVKAKYITINVEGYDYDKKVPLVEEGTVSIKAGQTKNMFVVVPGGFAYNKLTAGDLKSVRIVAVLFDEKDVQIATDNKDYNVEGPAPK